MRCSCSHLSYSRTVRLRMPGVRNHSVKNWAESAKWSNTHKYNLGGSSRKDDGWSREALDKKTLYEANRTTPQKILGILLKARLGSFIGYKNLVRKFFFFGIVVYTTAPVTYLQIYFNHVTVTVENPL